MDRSKVLEFFDATETKMRVHVVGCGAIGSHVCEELTRIGFPEVHIYDFDTVSSHNITNQMFIQQDIGSLKVDACEQYMKAINPDIKVIKHLEGLQEPYVLNGIIILCVDNIDLRRQIVQANKYNPNATCILDFRMRLTDAQHYFADCSLTYEVDQLLATMDFTHDEATAATPMSACGVELSVVYTVKAITAYGIANLITWLQHSKMYKTMILVNLGNMDVTTVKCTPRKPANNLKKLKSKLEKAGIIKRNIAPDAQEELPF